MSPEHTPRRRKLIDPGLQMRLVLSFLGVALLALLLQALVFGRDVASLADRSPELSAAWVEVLFGLLRRAVVLSVLVLLPLTLLVGILTTFRVAGPVHRLEEHLRAIGRGEDPGPCRIRKGDELQELCRLVNLAVERLRAQRRGREDEEAA